MHQCRCPATTGLPPPLQRTQSTRLLVEPPAQRALPHLPPPPAHTQLALTIRSFPLAPLAHPGLPQPPFLTQHMYPYTGAGAAGGGPIGAACGYNTMWVQCGCGCNVGTMWVQCGCGRCGWRGRPPCGRPRALLATPAAVPADPRACRLSSPWPGRDKLRVVWAEAESLMPAMTPPGPPDARRPALITPPPPPSRLQ